MKDKTTTVFGMTTLPLGGSVIGGNAVTAMSLDERLAAAIDLMNCLSELQRENADLPTRIESIREACPSLSGVDVGRYPELLRTMKRQTPPYSNNVFAAFLLFYVLSCGAYPQDCWAGAAAEPGATEFGQICEQTTALSSALSKAGADEVAEAVKGVERVYRRGVECADLEGLTTEETHVGLVKIYEMLWEVFVTKYEGYSNEVCPAEVDDAVAHHIQEVSYRLYDLLGCSGIARFDYIYNEEQKELYFLEVNTIPGQSAESIVPKQARAVGITLAELYEMAIEAALEG